MLNCGFNLTLCWLVVYKQSNSYFQLHQLLVLEAFGKVAIIRTLIGQTMKFLISNKLWSYRCDKHRFMVLLLFHSSMNQAKNLQ